jgi:hypothetical protein
LGFDYVQTDTGLLSSYEAFLDVAELTESAQRGGFFSYIAGTAAVMVRDYLLSNKRRTSLKPHNPSPDKSVANSTQMKGIHI